MALEDIKRPATGMVLCWVMIPFYGWPNVKG